LIYCCHHVQLLEMLLTSDSEYDINLVEFVAKSSATKDSTI